MNAGAYYSDYYFCYLFFAQLCISLLIG